MQILGESFHYFKTFDTRERNNGFYPSNFLEGRLGWEPLGLMVLGVRDLVLGSFGDMPLITYRSNLVNLQRFKLSRTHKPFGNVANGNFGSIIAGDLVSILRDDYALLKAEILHRVVGLGTSI